MAWGAIEVSEHMILKEAERPASRISEIAIDRKPYRVVAERGKKCGYDGVLKGIVACKSCTVSHERGFSPTPPKGPLDARYVVIGRNPGRKEGEFGEPFYPLAPGGRLLSEYLARLGITRDETYITNALFCYTLNDRPPTKEETAKCSLWKGAELQYLTHPKFIFLLGNDAVWSTIDVNQPSITKGYGKVWVYNGERHGWGEVFIFPIYHPGSCLRSTKLKMAVFKQLERLRELYIDPFRRFPIDQGDWTPANDIAWRVREAELVPKTG